ncbi:MULTISPECIES: CobW family GTP-binding protein [Edwardsiella]|uniref:GTP-binding protein n=1 Tax=Edwardsiella anguillarum TaxID=1821960 RepID=A0ABY8SDX6_9GAMM|nr:MULTISPECIES: GTP-binding protein [Edwardsiella]AKR78452.1 GTP-binding protein [Edwardsiella sp. LADL05-105]WHP82968.1 GTP-binding protein [Edwardsiella anguillarum]WHP86764.1 GTP-binding protein [Edwardsiella anguillarum]WHP90563.1 GTP-binding protein [Edwardsiella anguillarum]WHP94362.1 GTP-binding protein [Edwardsiella anguillarum]
MQSPVSVTLLTGFLGAGKTTLLNHYLRSGPDRRLAIVENEFGAVNLDGALLEADASVSVTELSNGCLCCSVRGEFRAALSDLLAQRRAGRLQFEHIIIESTGLADPAPIVQTFFVEPALRDALRLDAVIALADCQHLARQLDEHPVAAAQLGFADRILLTKADTVDDARREAVIARVRRINSRAELYQVEHGICPAALWLDLHAFTLSDDLSVSRGLHIVTAHAAATPRFQPFRAVPAPATAVDDAIQAHLLEGGELDLQRIGAFMERCVERHGNDMLRYKGVLAIADQPRRLVVQGIHRVVGFDYGSPWPPGEPRRSQLVIIGRHLPIATLRAEFNAAHGNECAALTVAMSADAEAQDDAR